MEEAEKPKTAFRTRKGLFKFKVMPFVMSNPPSVFQKLMDKVFRGLQWEKMSCVFMRYHRLRQSLLRNTWQPKMCGAKTQSGQIEAKGIQMPVVSAVREVPGASVSKDGIARDPEKTEAIQSWPVPSTVTQVQQFIGFASYYCKFKPIFFFWNCTTTD